MDSSDESDSCTSSSLSSMSDTTYRPVSKSKTSRKTSKGPATSDGAKKCYNDEQGQQQQEATCLISRLDSSNTSDITSGGAAMLSLTQYGSLQSKNDSSTAGMNIRRTLASTYSTLPTQVPSFISTTNKITLEKHRKARFRINPSVIISLALVSLAACTFLWHRQHSSSQGGPPDNHSWDDYQQGQDQDPSALQLFNLVFNNTRTWTSQRIGGGLKNFFRLDMLGTDQIINNKLPSILSPIHSNTPSKLVIAGKMTVGDTFCNIAELDLNQGEWSMKQRIQLSLYNSYSGGEVYYLLVNHTFPQDYFGSGDGEKSSSSYGNDESGDGSNNKNRRRTMNEGGELIVVGAFDTTDRNSQTTYCSVGEWDGTELSKVGEGLCNSALSKGMKITSAALAGPDDVYVAGSFTTQVWNGKQHEFVNIYNIAHYNAVDKVWLPLPVGQITCSWCKVTVLALAYDSNMRQLHVAGKFNSINGANIPSGLAIYDLNSGHLVAHPGGGLTMYNKTQDGVATALQLDEEAGVLYVMGAFERLVTGDICLGLAAFEIKNHKWTCLADAAHSVLPSGGGNMLLTPYGLMVAGRTTSSTTWPDSSRPYTIALLKTTLQKRMKKSTNDDDTTDSKHTTSDELDHAFEWSWLPGFDGHHLPLHALTNGFGDHEGTVFIAGDDLVAAWRFEETIENVKTSTSSTGRSGSTNGATTRTVRVPVTINLNNANVQGAIMAIAQLDPRQSSELKSNGSFPLGYTIAVYLIALGALLGMFLALLCNNSINQTLMSFLFAKDNQMNGISLDTLTYDAIKPANVNDAYFRAMKTRCVQDPHFLQLIDPQEIILHRIIGEGTFGRVWSARLHSSGVAVKEFVFAQAAVAGKSSQQNEIIEEIIGEAGMMAILRHPNVLQLFGCSLTAQAIWIVSELCSLGSLRYLLDDDERELPIDARVKIALQVAEGMSYLHNQDPPIIHRDLKSHNILVHETFTEKTNGEWTIRSEDIRRKDFSSSSSNKVKSPQPSQKTIHNSDRSIKMNSEATIVAKIGDWGSARATLSGSRTMTHGVGTACWLAPEVIKHARSSQQSDIYSYGIILWEVATREEVYPMLEGTQIIAQVANDNLRPPVPEGNPLAPLMVRCWQENPQDRPSFREIVKELNKILSDLSEEKTSPTISPKSSFSHSSTGYQNQHIEEEAGKS